jgi:hypothetical protein
VLHPGARVNRFEEKAAFTRNGPLWLRDAPGCPGDALRKSDVIDLTAKMRPDGTLDWTPPAGDWVVLRFGYSLLGITNHPATAEATGLEVDKLDRRYVKKYMDTYLDSYKETVGAELMGKRGIRYVVNDSWEAGSQNWTDNMIAQFKKRRGYDPAALDAGSHRAGGGERRGQRPLPVGLPQDHWRFDRRRALRPVGSDAARAGHGPLRRIARGRARLCGRWHGSEEVQRSAHERDVDADPGVNKEQYGYNADDRESASVAHIYGQNLAAAESMTAAAAPWAWSPATLKPTADQELLNGINRFVIHESAHQPLVGKAPGMTLGPFGSGSTATKPGRKQAGPWINYIARSSFCCSRGTSART